jgi:predicted nucleotidyltransferase
MPGASDDLLSRIATDCPGLQSIWLFGSRANGTSKADSDWDYLAFGTAETLSHIRAAVSLHREDTDFFVVADGNEFHAAWGDVSKSGSLVEWEWAALSESLAEYTQTKYLEQDDESRMDIKRVKALKVWPVDSELGSTK